MLHELAFLPGTSAARFTSVMLPTLLMASDHTAPPLLDAVHELGAAVPHAVVRVLPGQWHGIDDDTLVLTIQEFLNASADQSVTAEEAR